MKRAAAGALETRTKTAGPAELFLQALLFSFYRKDPPWENRKEVSVKKALCEDGTA